LKETIRYIIGYLIGFTVFIVLIPYGLFKLSLLDNIIFSKALFKSNLIRYFISAIICVIGAFFAIWSNLYLLFKGKGGPLDAFGVSISPQTKKLVTTGPYKYCRNPMVFGAFSFYLSVVLFLNSIIGLISLFIFLIIVILYLRFSEEKRLIKDFGNDYQDYRKRVSMIFPIKGR